MESCIFLHSAAESLVGAGVGAGVGGAVGAAEGHAVGAAVGLAVGDGVGLLGPGMERERCRNCNRKRWMDDAYRCADET